MNKRIWLNLLLLLVGAVLVYFIVYKPDFSSQDQKATELSAVRLFSIAPYQATDIYIQRKTQDNDKSDIVFHKTNDQWQLVKPGIAAVNTEKVKHLLTVVNEPVVASYDLTGKDLAPFGLSPGKVKLTINNEELTFGSTNAVTLNRYILKGSKVYTINEIVFGVLGGSVVNFLTHKLLPEGYKVQSVNAPALFNNLAEQFWTDVEARNMADYASDETVIGKIELSLSATEKTQEKVQFDILAIEPVLILGRPDLKIKYTFDKGIMDSYRKSAARSLPEN